MKYAKGESYQHWYYYTLFSIFNDNAVIRIYLWCNEVGEETEQKYQMSMYLYIYVSICMYMLVFVYSEVVDIYNKYNISCHSING